MKIRSIILAAVLSATAPAALAQPTLLRDELYIAPFGTVFAVVRSGGTIYVGGVFDQLGRFVNRGVPLDATTGVPVPGFPKVNNTIFAVAADGSGGWYIGGTFTNVGGLARSRIAHIDAANTVTAWNPGASNTVRTLAVDGSTVYVGGTFTSIGGQVRTRVAALDASTGLATSWNPAASGQVNTLAVDGGIVYVGGLFASIGGQARNRVAALDASTGLATAWDPNADGAVNTLAVAGSVVYAGGLFAGIGAEARNNIAAIDATTGLATAWDPSADGKVNALVVDGSTVYAGGLFATIGGEARPILAALDATSGLATSWDPVTFGDEVLALAVDGNTVYVGGVIGAFGAGASENRNNLAALDATTGLVTSWNPNMGGPVNALAVSGNTVYVGGTFTVANAVGRRNLAAIDAATGMVTAWDPNVESLSNGGVLALAVDGNTVYAGGTFHSVNHPLTSRQSIAAIDATTGFVTPWYPGHGTGPVEVLAVGGGRVYAGGSFTQIGGVARNRIAALDATSGLVTSWDPNADSFVDELAVDGSTVYAGGSFASIGGQARTGLAALDATSGLATAWNPSPNGPVDALAVSGGTVYVSGFFFIIGGQARSQLAAIDAATGLATTWDPNPNNSVDALAVAGSTVYAGGFFTSIGGQPRSRLAALDATTGAATPWNPNASGNGAILALAVDGSTAYVGGSFTTLAGEVGRRGFAGFEVPPSCAPPAITFCPPDVMVECGGSTSPSSTGTATASGTGVTVSHSDAFVAGCGGTGVITRTWTATGTCGMASCEQEITIVDTTSPVVTITGPAGGAVYPVGNAVSFSGSFTDGCGVPHTATWTFDATTQPGVVTEGAPGTVSASYTFTAAGVYKVKLTVTDHCGNAGMADQIEGANAMVVIYDPSAGFVTGNGTIDSPPGAYPSSPLLSGTASFGFVTKYKKGATVPTGETEFQFNAAGLSFVSSALEWLVVSGARAQYKGTGTLNALGGYEFQLTAVDGALLGGGATDRFRIKIKDLSGVVYDNQINDPDDATPSTELLSGSIVIHAGGKKNSPADAGPQAEEPGAGSISAIPVEFGLSQSHPNPFSRSARIAFHLPERSRVSLVLYDLAGRVVRTLVEGEWEPGRHSAMLARVSGGGDALGHGVYFLRMSARSLASERSFTSLRKVVVLE